MVTTNNLELMKASAKLMKQEDGDEKYKKILQEIISIIEEEEKNNGRYEKMKNERNSKWNTAP